VPVEVTPTPGEHRATTPLHVVEDRTPVRKLEFVEVGPAPATSRRRRPAAGPGAGPEYTVTAEPVVGVEGLAQIPPGEPRWSLWSDAEV
jgi:hypothetical protein